MNLVALVGRLTKDPEMFNTDGDKPICKFTLAVQKEYHREQADFIRISTWNKQAEHCGKYLRQGSLISLKGRLSTSTYKNVDGKNTYAVEVAADKVIFLSSSKTDNSDDTPMSNNKPIATKNTTSTNKYTQKKADDGLIECKDDNLPF